jgi:hypothetical protein
MKLSPARSHTIYPYPHTSLWPPRIWACVPGTWSGCQPRRRDGSWAAGFLPLAPPRRTSTVVPGSASSKVSGHVSSTLKGSAWLTASYRTAIPALRLEPSLTALDGIEGHRSTQICVSSPSSAWRDSSGRRDGQNQARSRGSAKESSRAHSAVRSIRRVLLSCDLVAADARRARIAPS